MKTTSKIVTSQSTEIEPGDLVKYKYNDDEKDFVILMITTDLEGIVIYKEGENENIIGDVWPKRSRNQWKDWVTPFFGEISLKSS